MKLSRHLLRDQFDVLRGAQNVDAATRTVTVTDRGPIARLRGRMVTTRADAFATILGLQQQAEAAVVFGPEAEVQEGDRLRSVKTGREHVVLKVAFHPNEEAPLAVVASVRADAST